MVVLTVGGWDGNGGEAERALALALPSESRLSRLGSDALAAIGPNSRVEGGTIANIGLNTLASGCYAVDV